MKQVAILQSNYIPWKGYFDLINMVDEFVLYDDVQYTRRDWRNRNIIKTPAGPKWLTIPVEVKGKYLQRINETRISDPLWGKHHWSSIIHNYARAKYFKQFAPVFEALYLQSQEELLSRVNHSFIVAICSILGVTTKLSWSSDYPNTHGRNERLISLCKSTDATHYVSGPAAKSYIDEALFQADGISVSYIDYGGYPVHTQLYGDFDHHVTILDLLFNEGPNATRFMKSFATTA